MNLKTSSGILRCIAPAAIAFALACALAPRAAAKPSLPAWLAEASNRTAPMDKDTAAVTLHDEEVVTVSSNGKISTTFTEATRIVTRDGRAGARIAIPYDSSSAKITAFKAWLARPDGDTKTYGIKDAADVASAPEAVYAESRVLALSASDDAYENCIFACEYTVEDRGVFGQDMWTFQANYPVALSRVTYNLPKGWSIKATTENHEPIAPKTGEKGNTFTWELRDLPAIKTEPLGPPPSRIAPRLDIDLIPPGANSGADARKLPRLVFPTWTAVSIYGAALHQKPATPDATVAAKTRELLAAAGANASLWARINALARFAQAMNYVSIQMNEGRGGGYTPRAAQDVLKTGYGDCKDKATLLRALLAAAGIESYPVMAYSGDRYHVTADWPTPFQFNHCIAAIKIDDPSLKSPAIVEHPVLGRLLFFDPTDPYTPLGDLPQDEQGSQVLVLAGERGGLARLPFAAPADNHVDRPIEAALRSDGAIAVRLKEHSTGQAAAQERAAYHAPMNKYADTIRSWINDGVPSSKILKTDAVDSQEHGTFDLTVDFAALGYAKMMRDELLVFKPAIVSRRDFTPLTKPTRAYPVILTPRSYSETAVITIPDGYTVDELPPPTEAAERFGHYKATTDFDAEKKQVRYQRTLEMSAAEIPVSEYATVRQFYETMRKAEQTPVVLRRQ